MKIFVSLKWETLRARAQGISF